MKERPILFSAPMVRAILEGRKTQTRRVVKPQPAGKDLKSTLDGKWFSKPFGGLVLPMIEDLPIECPYGQLGDRLYVREAWATHSCFDAIPPRDLTTRSIHYQADGKAETGKYRQAFHMPRWASRILLEITAVRVERLNDISEADSRAEGCPWSDGAPDEHGLPTQLVVEAKDEFVHLWRSINGPGSWETNPWVWVIEFKKVTP